MKQFKELCAGFALTVAATLALWSFEVTNDITANMLILVAQFLVYSLTLLGFGEIARKIYKTTKK